MGVVEISNPPTCDNDFTPTISAIANPGYHFSGWSDGDTLNPRTIVLTSDTVLEAYFAADIVNYTVTVLSANSEMGAVTGSGIYSEGSSAEISAIANVGYQSLNWDDSKTEKTRIITATSDTTIIANFDVVDRVENVELYVEIYTNGNSVYINGAEGETLVIYDVCGHVIYQGIAKDNKPYELIWRLHGEGWLKPNTKGCHLVVFLQCKNKNLAVSNCEVFFYLYRLSCGSNAFSLTVRG